MKKKKAILITGAAQRLGLHCARHTLRLGYDVVFQYRTDNHLALKWLEDNPQHKPHAHFIRAELTTDGAALFSQIKKLPVQLCGLVNNASLFTKGNLLDPAHFKSTLDNNVLAQLDLCNRFYQAVRTGWIINITDAHITPKSRAYQNYRISKQLLELLTEQLAYTYAPRVRVNAIAPGAMIPATSQDRHYFKNLAKTIPLHVTGDISGLLQAYEYLISAKAVTGQTMYIDAGWHII